VTKMGLKRLDCFLTEKIDQAREIPGVVVLVRCRNEVVFHEAYGFRQTVPARLPMKRETLFDLASLTKPLSTGLLAMQMWHQGKLKLEQTLAACLGNIPDPVKQRITVRDLLSNRSGFPGWKPYYQDYSPAMCPVPGEEIQEKILSESLESPPGTTEVYSDLGFMLLGWILEHSTGIPLDQLFKQEISAPLGLKRTGYRDIRKNGKGRLSGEDENIAATENCSWRHRIVIGEVHDENCYMLGGTAGHAGLFSTPSELDRVVAEIFKGLEAQSRIFQGDALRTFFQRPADSAKGSWALGWDTPSPEGSTSGRHFSKDSVGHTGFTGTSLWMDMEQRIAVILLTNRVHPDRDATAIRSLRPRLHDLILEELLEVR